MSLCTHVWSFLTRSSAASQYAGIADNDLLYFSYTNQVTQQPVGATCATHQGLLCLALVEAWPMGTATTVQLQQSAGK